LLIGVITVAPPNDRYRPVPLVPLGEWPQSARPNGSPRDREGRQSIPIGPESAAGAALSDPSQSMLVFLVVADASGRTTGGRGSSKVFSDQFLRQLDHRGHVAEGDLLRPGVRG